MPRDVAYEDGQSGGDRQPASDDQGSGKREGRTNVGVDSSAAECFQDSTGEDQKEDGT